VKPIGFRGRLFVILLSFALLPSLVLTVAWAATNAWAFSLVGSTGAWEAAATSGERALKVAKSRRLSPADSAAVAQHEQTLSMSMQQARRARFVYQRAPLPAAIALIVAFAGLLVLASRVAGHLSRSLSRPLQEVVGWTEHIVRAEPLPTESDVRGAPEFGVLRDRMREMAAALDLGRRAALEAERASAFRETARQVAHELKNPLTPIKFAVERLRRDAQAWTCSRRKHRVSRNWRGASRSSGGCPRDRRRPWTWVSWRATPRSRPCPRACRSTWLWRTTSR
jgi:signal transduction histidine kinase